MYRRRDERTTTSDGFLAGKIDNKLHDQRVAGLVQFHAIPVAMLVYFALNFVET